MKGWTIATGHLPLAMAVACTSAAPVTPQAPNLLLVTIDTFRADRVGTGVAPAIDRLAASGLRFTAARTPVPLTLPAHASIHTGLLPPAHGVRENGATLASAHRPIASILKAAGYDTAAFVGAFVLDRRFGLAAGFDTFDDQIPRDPSATERLEAERPASAVVDRALGWLAARTKDHGPEPHAPFFLWIHLYDPHAPYEPPAEYRARARTPYDGEIAYADAQLGRLLESLRTQGLMERTLVVAAGDHGEGLGDHGERTHGMLLYDSTLRVPLIVHGPGIAAARRDEAVSLTDVAPTILQAAGIAAPVAMKGRNLLVSSARADDLFSETEYPRVAGWSPLQALTDGRWMAIRAGAATELYDLDSDPGEQHDVSHLQGTVASAMSARAGALHASAATAAAAAPQDARERLRALGYVAGSSPPGPVAGARNPAAAIAMWNEFEGGLAELAAHRPGAVATLRKLAAADPDAPVFQATYARALKEAGQLRAALAVYRQTVRRWPTDAALFHDLAVTAREVANAAPDGPAARAMREEATRADEAALALDPNSATAHNGLGLLAADEGRAGAAVQAFERATAIDANNASYWTNLGNARRAAGDRTAAEQAYRRALDVDARAADAANGVGVLLVEANHPAEAVPWFERAVAAAPDLVEARLNLGIALQQSGETARAGEVYRQVIAAPAQHTRERDAASKLLASLKGAR